MTTRMHEAHLVVLGCHKSERSAPLASPTTV